MIRTLCLGAALLLAGGPASAHVLLQPAAAPPGARADLQFRLGHGCQGRPTTAVRIELPAGARLLSAANTPGWTMQADPAAGTVTWRGETPAATPVTFAMTVKLPVSPARLAFPTTQSCGDQTLRWDQRYEGEGPRPERPAPMLNLAAASPAAAPTGVPPEVQVKDGAFVDAAGRPLYTFNFDTMVGMSHCEGDCARMWPPLLAPPSARPSGDWTLVTREDGSRQWAYRTKPLYTYSKDQPGGPALGLEAPNWKIAK